MLSLQVAPAFPSRSDSTVKSKRKSAHFETAVFVAALDDQENQLGYPIAEYVVPLVEIYATFVLLCPVALPYMCYFSFFNIFFGSDVQVAGSRIAATCRLRVLCVLPTLTAMIAAFQSHSIKAS
jgi:hypothetical protein